MAPLKGYAGNGVGLLLKMTESQNKEKQLSGITICPGIGFGKVQILDHELPVVRTSLLPGQVKREQKRYAQAVKIVGDHLDEHVKEAHSSSWLSATQILKVHKAILDDQNFHESISRRIADRLENAEWALYEESGSIISKLEVTRDPYFQARAEDIRDLAANILNALTGSRTDNKRSSGCLEEDTVIFTHNLYPSTAVQSRRFCATGFATESRLLASHAAILLKGFGIPAVGGVKDLRKVGRDGTQAIIDGVNGKVILCPTPATIKKYRALLKSLEIPSDSPPLPPTESTTRDGTMIHLAANIETPEQVDLMHRFRLEGIGLFRTEFLVLNTDTFPQEEEQYTIYRRVIEEAAGRRVVIRTFDIGADKQNPNIYRDRGQNPALGVRGIRRHLLCCPEELHTQFRAILRASANGNVGILIPMVTTIEDIRWVKKLLAIVQKELRRDRKLFSTKIDLGAMIEVPAAAFATGDILQEVDFISVGTNDLLQYFLASDRDNPELVEYWKTPSPGFFSLMKMIIEQAANLKRREDVGICGEMASSPTLLPNLIQLGYRSFSISPVLAPSVRKTVSGTDLSFYNGSL